MTKIIDDAELNRLAQDMGEFSPYDISTEQAKEAFVSSLFFLYREKIIAQSIGRSMDLFPDETIEYIGCLVLLTLLIFVGLGVLIGWGLWH